MEKEREGCIHTLLPVPVQDHLQGGCRSVAHPADPSTRLHRATSSLYK